MTAKHSTHVAHPAPTPPAQVQVLTGVGVVIAGLLIIGVPLIAVAFWLSVIRLIWRRGSTKQAA